MSGVTSLATEYIVRETLLDSKKVCETVTDQRRARKQKRMIRKQAQTNILMNIITIGSLSKLTRRPKGGGHIQISIQLKSE